MSLKYLGESFDLHTGGVDNIFPHHENEIAQSEGATGRPFVRYWMHAAHLRVDGEKMAKSKGNFYTLRDLLERGHEPRAIRLLLLGTHYRNPLNFTFDALAQATSEVGRLDDLRARLAREPGTEPGHDEAFDGRLGRETDAFREALAEDLNISNALGAVFRVARETHAAMDRGELPAGTRGELGRTLDLFDGVLDVRTAEPAELENEIAELIRQRDQARKARNYGESDRIRDELSARGILLEDTPGGTVWKRRLG
jgi:cysteinyl-tRNA synthetase